MTTEDWVRLDFEEQVDCWLAVPDHDAPRFIAAARPSARLLFEALPSLSLNGDTAGDRVVLKMALRRGNWMENAAELSQLSNDDERLNRFIDNLRWSRHGARNWAQGLDPAVFDLWPAYELFASTGRIRPGTKERWQEAGGKLYSGKMIALKTDPVWKRFSKFGRVHPPYDVLPHHLDVRDVERDRAVRLGLLRG